MGIKKSHFIIVLFVIPIILGSMAVSLSSVNEIIHVFTSYVPNPQQPQASSNNANPQTTSAPVPTASSSSNSPSSNNDSESPLVIRSPEWEMNRVVLTTKSSSAPIVGAIADRTSPSTIDAIKNAVPQMRSNYVSKFGLALNPGSESSFGIGNSDLESQIFLVRTLGPSEDLIIEGRDGAAPIYHITYSNRWLVEVKPGNSGTLHFHSTTNSQRTVEVEVERVLSLDQSQFSVAPAITGVSQVATEVRQKAVTALSVNELSSTHFTWALVNIKDEPIVYLLRLDTIPELWINLEIIDKSANRVFQYTDEGYFLVEISPYGKGKFQSAVSGSSFTIISEVTQIT
jgi:hypothetical protein